MGNLCGSGCCFGVDECWCHETLDPAVPVDMDLKWEDDIPIPDGCGGEYW